MRTSGSLLIFSLLLTAATRGGDVKEGKRIFDQSCAGCHSVDGKVKKTGPSMKGLFRRPKMKDSVTPINDLTLRLSTSIGISIYPDDAETVDALISIADYALYEAKRSGKNRFCSTAGAAPRQGVAKAAPMAPLPELAPHR